MNKKIIIRQATLADEHSIAKFYEVAFDHAHFKYKERWKWLYQNNPFFTSNKSLPIWLAIHQGKIIGMSCLMPQHFCIKHRTFKAAWCNDLRVLPEYRGKGLGTQLEKLRREAGHVLSLASSQNSVLIKKKLGYSSKPLHVVYLHVRRFNSRFLFNDLLRYLRCTDNTKLYNLCQVLNLPKFISALLLIAFKWKQYRAKTSNNGRLQVTFKSTHFFPREVDDLWNKIKGNYSLAVKRDCEYLNWKFVNQPHISYQRYLVYKDAELCGVLIFRHGRPPELPIGIISEFYTSHSSRVLRQMLTFAVSMLYDQGCLMIKCSSSTEERSNILTSMGFIPIHKHLSTFSFSPNNTDAFTEIAVKGDWLMGLGDQDLDEYPRVSHPSLKNLIMVILGRTPGDALIKTFH